MSPLFILGCIAGYFVFLLLIAAVTTQRATNDSYFLGNKASPWLAVAFGLIGDSLSGVTFISVPGKVGVDKFSYLQMVLGFSLGYVVIARVLLPLYYQHNLISIYSYLRERFGVCSQKTGSFFFLISRLIGAAFRLYLTASVLQQFVFDRWGVPYFVTVATIILLILVYTLKGGIKTLVWTDTFQSTFLLLGLVLSLHALTRELGGKIWELPALIQQSGHGQVFFWDWQAKNFFFKQFLSGAFIAIVMTGLDQNMMQKNLSCRSLADAQKNLYWFSGVIVLVNLCFLGLGALLHLLAQVKNLTLPAQTDQLFPMLALQHLGPLAAASFIIGLTAATFSSADSVLTTLTTSFCMDLLEFDRRTDLAEARKTTVRLWVHVGFAALLLLVIVLFRAVNNQAVINAVFTLAGYTYGPLLGLFAFGLFRRRLVYDRWVPLICVLSPLLTYLIDQNSARWLGGYRFGFELLMVNGLLTYLGLCLLSRRLALD